jgi:hypothetical protein
MTSYFSRKNVKLSLLEYDDRFIPFPLFALSLSLITVFTLKFPILAYASGPFTLFLIYSIFAGDIALVDDDSNELSITMAQNEEE